MSIFNAEEFLDATTTEAATKRPPLPADGRLLQATITKISGRNWQGKKDPTQSGIAFDVTVEINLEAYPEIQKVVGLPKVSIQDGIMIDLNEGGAIDWAPGRNAKARRYREALGLNVAGQPFNFRMFEGRTLLVKIKHDPYEGEIYDKIDSVAKAA